MRITDGYIMMLVLMLHLGTYIYIYIYVCMKTEWDKKYKASTTYVTN